MIAPRRIQRCPISKAAISSVEKPSRNPPKALIAPTLTNAARRLIFQEVHSISPSGSASSIQLGDTRRRINGLPLSPSFKPPCQQSQPPMISRSINVADGRARAASQKRTQSFRDPPAIRSIACFTPVTPDSTTMQSPNRHSEAPDPTPCNTKSIFTVQRFETGPRIKFSATWISPLVHPPFPRTRRYQRSNVRI